MPRRGRKLRTNVSPSVTPKKKRKLTQKPSSPVNDSPAKNTRSQLTEQPCSPEKETEFKPRKCMFRSLTQEEEDRLVEWLRENDFLYNKCSAEFKFRDKKTRAWTDKETELGLNPGDLFSIWYPNMRTQYSKLIKASSKSGSAAPERTARQQWLLDSFEFLRPFLIQLRNQRGSKFAEKRKELAPEEDTVDAYATLNSDVPAPSESPGSTRQPKAAQVLTSLTSELESVRGAITGAQDGAAQTGQFLVYLMRQMDQQRMATFERRVTRLALDLVDESQEEKRRLSAQQSAPQAAPSEFAVPSPPMFISSAFRRRSNPTAAAGSADQLHQMQQQLHQDFQLATNLAASAPPAHLTPYSTSYTHLQPPNVQPTFFQQPLSSSSPKPAITSPSTSSIIRRAMDAVSTPNNSFSLSQETFEDHLNALRELPSLGSNSSALSTPRHSTSPKGQEE